MDNKDPRTPHRPDIHVNALNGIDLRIHQNNLFVGEGHMHHLNFRQIQKTQSKFPSSGLWRKKRDIGSSNPYPQS
jgi:hypothetical protein